MSSHLHGAAPGVSFHGVLSPGGVAIGPALRFTAAAGRWTALLGRSGVGKTTLLRVLAGAAAPEDASGGATASDGLPLAGRTAWMAQTDLLTPWATARDNVVLGARLRNEPPDWAAADAALAAVGLADKAHASPAQLSGGQRQRVALARTLLEDRPIALLDEPFSALDAATRSELQDLAWRMLANRTVVLVTHDPLEAARLAHEAYVVEPDAITPLMVPTTAPPRDLSDPAIAAAAGRLTRVLTAA